MGVGNWKEEQEIAEWVAREARKLRGEPEPGEGQEPFKFPPEFADYCRKCGAEGVFVRMALMCPRGCGFIGGI